MGRPQLNHSAIGGHSGCFQFLAVTDKAVMNICVDTSFNLSGLSAQECNCCILWFSFLNELPNYFLEWLYHFTVPPAVYEIQFLCILAQHLILSPLFILAFLIGSISGF